MIISRARLDAGEPTLRMMKPWPSPSNSSRSDRKSTRLNSSHSQISYAVFCLKKKNADAAVERLPVRGQQQVEMLHFARMRRLGACVTWADPPRRVGGALAPLQDLDPRRFLGP